MRKSREAKRKMQVIMILYGYLPIDTRVLREARVLTDAGYDVSVLDLDSEIGELPILRGVRRCSVLRIPVLKRTTIGGLLLFWVACLKYLIQNRHSIDIVHAHDLTGLPPAFVISVLRSRIRLVYDAHELFPEAAMDKLSFLHYVLFLGLELICSTRVGWLISVSPCNLRTLSHRIGATPFLLLNVPDLDRVRLHFGHIPRWRGLRDDSTIKIAYPGHIITLRGYEKLPEAAQILNTNDEVEFEFLIIGDGALLPELRRMVRERDLENHFTFTGHVSFEKVQQLIVECDIAIALYEDTWNNNSCLSNKIFEYMMVGIPFIFTNLIQSLPLLEMVGAYTLENPVSGGDIANAILSLHSNTDRMDKISKTGLRLVASRFNWAKESERLVKAYRDIQKEVFGW